MQKAAQSAMTEVDFGKLAAEKAPSPSVRQFALRSVATFSRAGGMLNALAGDAGVTLPRQPSPDARKLTEALAHDPAGVIDEEYMAQVLPASTMTVSLFESEAQNGRNPKLKQFATRMLPELQQRRNLAVRLSKSPGTTRQAMRNRAYPQGTPR